MLSACHPLFTHKDRRINPTTRYHLKHNNGTCELHQNKRLEQDEFLRDLLLDECQEHISLTNDHHCLFAFCHTHRVTPSSLCRRRRLPRARRTSNAPRSLQPWMVRKEDPRTKVMIWAWIAINRPMVSNAFLISCGLRYIEVISMYEEYLKV